MRVTNSVAGPLLERVLDAEHALSDGDLSRHAYGQLDAALARTAWGAAHRRRVALVDDGHLLASATRFDFAAVLDDHALRVCGIGALVPAAVADAQTRQLVADILAAAEREGIGLVLLHANLGEAVNGASTLVVPLMSPEIHVAKPARRGAPMMLIRGGERRDLDAIVAMGRIRATPFRFHLDRSADLVHHAIAKQRLRAGLGAAGARQLHFFIAEEGVTAAAYVVIGVVGSTWTVEECGDRDPSGARVGGILQALIAREPIERVPTIRASFPPGFIPPQVAAADSRPSTDVMTLHFVGDADVPADLSADEVLYWRNDIF